MVSVAIAIIMGADSAPIKLVKEFSKQELPFERINGISVTEDKWVVGSMRGLYVGTPGGEWEKISDQSIRQVVSSRGETWALYGNGSVDKMDVKSNRLYYDVLQGAVKRPWVGSISAIDNKILLGGSGGWFEKLGEKSLTESYPDQLTGKHVTSLSKAKADTLIGTQDGLFVSNGKQIKRFGFGDGLSDVWITSMIPKNNFVAVGSYNGGLYFYQDRYLIPVETPSKKIRNLLVWKSQLVVGTLEGTWIENGKKWTSLAKGENTFLSTINGSLVVGTPASITFFR